MQRDICHQRGTQSLDDEEVDFSQKSPTIFIVSINFMNGFEIHAL